MSPATGISRSIIVSAPRHEKGGPLLSGDTRCAVVGKVGAGTHKAFLSAREAGWALLQFQDAAGWIAERLIDVQKVEAAAP